MHKENITEFFELWRSMLDRHQSQDPVFRIQRAYVYGVFCHYFLDRTTHPYVFAYIEALCSAGVKGLDPEDDSYVHGQLEADLDMYLLYRLTGRTLEEYRIPKQVLYSSDAALLSIDMLYLAAAEIFGLKIPRNAFSQSVKDMRLAQKVLYSPRGTKRRVFGNLERLVRKHSYLQAMSHSSEAQNAAWYANEDKHKWLHPKTREASNKSFFELFEDAMKEVQAQRELFDSGAPISEITRGYDFFGNHMLERADC
jgi:hypothetical protein